jgi:glycosyltransferase involved in cell wall biosynthesis
VEARYRWLLGLVNAAERGLARRFDQVFVHNRFQVEKFQRADRPPAQVGSYPNRHMIPRAPTGSGRDGFVIGRLGTIYEDNGIEEILEAYRLLLERERRRGGSRRYHLYLAGRVFDRYAPTFQRLVEPPGPITARALRGFRDGWLYRQLDRRSCRRADALVPTSP